jgi:hypothetical protein
MMKTIPQYITKSDAQILSNNDRAMSISPPRITKCERLHCPPVRFIGKRSTNFPDWGAFWANNWFDEIEKAGPRAALNDDSYCVLTGFSPDGTECYLGEFFPENTVVPEGFDHADLPAMDAALCFVQGPEGECHRFVNQRREELIAEIERNGMTLPKGDPPPRWATFERDNCPRWTTPDADGNVILDFAIFLA